MTVDRNLQIIGNINTMISITELYSLFRQSAGVTTDSREVRKGEMFFALRGENFDGNDYASKALEARAAYAVVSSDSRVASESVKDSRIIPVEDTLSTLKELARTHRCSMTVEGKRLPVIALTGTNGKTTTKELINAVLSVKYRVTATRGNLNNEIGVPLSLLSITPETRIAVIEMGASHPGDIESLVSVAMPDYGLVTNVGKGHLLGFGSFEGVRKTKGELYDYIGRNGGKIFLNEDLPYLREMAEERGIDDVVPYGVEYDGAKILPVSPDTPFLKMEIPVSCGESTVLETHLVGQYNAGNVMAALSIGRYFGVPVEDCLKAIASYIPSNNRSQMSKTGRNTLVIDAYNANPVSMEAALSSLESIPSDNKSVMLGDMLELGTESGPEHDKIVERVCCMHLQEAYFVGQEFSAALSRCKANKDRCISFGTSGQLADYLKEHPVAGSVILIKGSHGIHMEKVIPEL